MRKPLAVSVSIGLIVPLVVGATVTLGSSTDTKCWDEYNKRGTRMYRTVTPTDLPVEDCTPADSCLWGYRIDGRRNRLYVPHRADPATACDDLGAAVTTTVVATLPSTAHAPTPATDRFETLPVGAALPSQSDCATMVRPTSENRPENDAANSTPGTAANTVYPRVTGSFTGTTDEILQWTACKWGIDEDWVRAQIANESSWSQNALGDFTADPAVCAPGFPIGNYEPQYNGDNSHVGECPESIGLGQVRWLYHQSAFVDGNATKSTAYNLDYTYAVWRECFEGRMSWLNDVGRGAEYVAGDARGCLGVWFSGRWYTDAAIGYIERFDSTLGARTWEQDWFDPAMAGDSSQPVVSTPAPAATSPTTASPTPSATTSPATNSPTTTSPEISATTSSTTTSSATANPQSVGAQFMETFDGNRGLDRFRWGVYHRDVGHSEAGRAPQLSGWNNAQHGGTWTGDHDISCGSPDTQRPLRSEFGQDTTGANGWEPYVDFHVRELVYSCRDHLMTSMGDVAAYSIVWFSPDQVFETVDSVSFDVNLTDLGNRQWWKVGVVSDTLFDSTTRAGALATPTPGFLVSDVDASGLDGNLQDSDRLIATWSGGASAGYPGGLKVGNQQIGGGEDAGSDKRSRHPVSLSDNGDGTVTFSVADSTATVSGSFPQCPCRVVFYDHNYTPDKDAAPTGHTWHWDNFVIR